MNFFFILTFLSLSVFKLLHINNAIVHSQAVQNVNGILNLEGEPDSKPELHPLNLIYEQPLCVNAFIDHESNNINCQHVNFKKMASWWLAKGALRLQTQYSMFQKTSEPKLDFFTLVSVNPAGHYVHFHNIVFEKVIEQLSKIDTILKNEVEMVQTLLLDCHQRMEQLYLALMEASNEKRLSEFDFSQFNQNVFLPIHIEFTVLGADFQFYEVKLFKDSQALNKKFETNRAERQKVMELEKLLSAFQEYRESVTLLSFYRLLDEHCKERKSSTSS